MARTDTSSRTTAGTRVLNQPRDYCLMFDGTNGVAIPYENIGTTITYAIWCFFPVGANSLNLFSFMRTLIRITGTAFSWLPDISIAATTILTGGTPRNEWTHFVITQTGTTYSLYINGVLKSNGTTNLSTEINTLSSSNQIGRYNSGSHWTNRIADVRMWSVELTAAEVAEVYFQGSNPQPDALKRWYKLDEGSGTTAIDSTRNAQHGTHALSYSTDTPFKSRTTAGARTTV